MPISVLRPIPDGTEPPPVIVTPPPPIDEPEFIYKPAGEYSDLERLFIAEQPRFLWPENQETNFGALRKTLTDVPQLAVDQLLGLSLEMFVATASGYLTLWEEQVGLPRNPNGEIGLRRATILERTRKTPFTRERRRNIVERYLQGQLGESVALTPDGVALTTEGLELFTGVLGDVTLLYFILEIIEDYRYIVFFDVAATPDLVALERELEFFTPAGITFEFDTFVPGTGRRYGDYNYGDFNYGGDEA